MLMTTFFWFLGRWEPLAWATGRTWPHSSTSPSPSGSGRTMYSMPPGSGYGPVIRDDLWLNRCKEFVIMLDQWIQAYRPAPCHPTAASKTVNPRRTFWRKKILMADPWQGSPASPAVISVPPPRTASESRIARHLGHKCALLTTITRKFCGAVAGLNVLELDFCQVLMIPTIEWEGNNLILQYDCWLIVLNFPKMFANKLTPRLVLSQQLDCFL